MRAPQVLQEALSALSTNRLRTSLTMLGVIIGVSAVVIMLAVGRGAQSLVNQSISSMGSNLLVVFPGSQTSGGIRFGAGAAQTLTISDAVAAESVTGVIRSAPIVMRSFQLGYGNTNWSAMVTGVTTDYFPTRSWDAEEGDLFSDADIRSNARVAVIGQSTAKQLFGDEAPIGKTMRIRNLPFTVIGILSRKGQSLDGRDQDDAVFIPLSTARQQLIRSTFPGSINLLFVQVASAEAMPVAEAELNDLLRVRHRIGPGQENDFTIRNLTAIAQTAAVAAGAMAVLLGAIAGVSLLVGGIGIMNIMLVSVTERTREIGIRMAIGARQRDILRQFLIEAIAICLAGGAVGAGLGIAGAWLIASFSGLLVEISMASIALAFGFSAAIGIFFGWYPAAKASRLRPVEALRIE
ncbi:MAG: FtsX-like permease family protein [Burkholderiaceae bacterium]|nr:FtsX-like permease family protein [Burkholderiaceae bacterium]